jgi:transposase InsO family protein
MARENPSWGYDRIAGVLQNLGHDVLDQSVGNILKAHGIEPAPDRKRQTTWKTFLKAHWGVLAAIDFTTVEVWTKGGFVTYYLLFVMELKARRVHFAGCTVNPHEAWMKQTARELTSCDDGFLDGKRNLIMDRDTKFCESFRSILRQSDGEPVVLPRESPNLNSQLEKYFGSLKSRCLSRMIFLGKQSLERAVREYVEHHHRERNHQGLGNRLIDPGEQVGAPGGKVACSERLGGLLRNYHRSAESLFASDSSSLHHWMLTFRAEAIVLVLQHDRGRCSAFRRPKLRPEIVVNSTLREQTTCGPFQFFDLTIFQEQTP